jgi:hypothetical protein
MSDPGTKIHHLARNERPMCEDCNKQMWLFSVKPSGLGFDVRTYECSGCSASKTLLVKADNRPKVSDLA